MHLTADELVDIAEGTRSLSSVPHVRACDVCRRHVDMLRAAIDVASSARDVPEPSPLFWEQFSGRVRAAVVEDPQPSRAWWRRPWAAVTISGAAAAAAVLIVIGETRPRDASPPPAPAASVATIAARETLGDIDDDSLALVADLASDLDFDAAREAGLTGRGAAEHAVTHLNDGELGELQQLLREQMVSP